MKIKAKFKGSNSLGYVNGENYWLEFHILSEKMCIWIYGEKQFMHFCKYDSLKAFLNNWQVF